MGHGSQDNALRFPRVVILTLPNAKYPTLPVLNLLNLVKGQSSSGQLSYLTLLITRVTVCTCTLPNRAK